MGLFNWLFGSATSQTKDKTTSEDVSPKPKKKSGVIGKVKVGGLYKYVILDHYGVIYVGNSIWWYTLTGKDSGEDYDRFDGYYQAARFKEAAGHVYPVLNMADLLDDDKRKQLLEKLNA